MDDKKFDALFSEKNALENLAEYVLFMDRCSGEVKDAVEHQRPMTPELYRKCEEELKNAGLETILQRFRQEFGGRC